LSRCRLVSSLEIIINGGGRGGARLTGAVLISLHQKDPYKLRQNRRPDATYCTGISLVGTYLVGDPLSNNPLRLLHLT
jgi:hypothetical protein